MLAIAYEKSFRVLLNPGNKSFDNPILRLFYRLWD